MATAAEAHTPNAGKTVRHMTATRLFILFFALLLGFVAFHWDRFAQPISADGYALENAYAACVDNQGRYAVIDSGMTRVILMDRDGFFLAKIDHGFDDVSLLAASDDGTLYLAADGGTRLLRYDSALEEVLVLPSGKINALACTAEDVLYAVTADDATRVLRLSDGSELFRYDHVDGRYETAFAIAAEGQGLYFVTMMGDVWHADASGAQSVYTGRATLEDTNRTIARNVSVSPTGLVCFTDAGTRVVRQLLPDGSTRDVTPDREHVAAQSVAQRSALIRLTACDDGVVVTDRNGLSRGNADGELVFHTANAYYTPGQRGFLIALWVMLYLCAVMLVLLLLLLMRGKKRKLSDTGRVAIGVGAFAVVVSLVLAIALPGIYRDNTNALVMDNIKSLARVTNDLGLAEDITAIHSLEDYDGTAYRRLKGKLDSLIQSDNAAMALYYMVYVHDDSLIIPLLDSTGDAVMFEYSQNPYEGSDTQRYNYDQGLQMDYPTYSDATGDWTFSVVPVKDNAGQVVAIVELGTNSRALNQSVSASITELLLTLLTLMVVLFMAYNEGIHMIRFLTARKLERKQAVPPEARESTALGLRPLTFLFYVAISLQSAFVPILASRLYTPISWLPAGMASAVTLSVSLFTTALFGMIGGKLMTKFRPRTLLVVGCLLTAVSFGMIALRTTFVMLLLGRLCSGVGMGLALVSINTMASNSRDEAVRAKGFTCYNAGMIAGLNLGTVLGSQFVEWIGYSGVYGIATALLLVTAGWAFAMLPSVSVVRSAPETSDAPRKLSMLRFFGQRSVWSFFLFVFVPYTIASYYMYYFFPLFADAQGMSEANIGRFYLLAGLIVAGCGPSLTAGVRSLVGVKYGNVLAGGLYAVLLVLFATFPTMEMAIVLVIALSLVDGFGFSLQNIYYTGLPVAAEFGVSQAMGVFSLTENIAQTSAPLIFAAAMTLGTSAGIAVIGGGCAVLLPLFLACSGKRNAKAVLHAKA